MDERNLSPQEPWDQDSYTTGVTQPPKNRRGLVTVLLVTVIFLGGIASVLGFLNIRLLEQLNDLSGNGGMSFYEDAPPKDTDPTGNNDPVATGTGADINLELNQTPDSVDNIPQAGGLSYQEIYEKAIDSVVSVTCNTGTGTGVVLDERGYIVTNYHVIDNATSIEIILNDGRQLTARVVGSDVMSDLAVLCVDATDLKAAEFGDDSTLRVGDAVAAIGDPLGPQFRGTMTDGIISAINRDVMTEYGPMTFIQTNAALNSGNSGGPLLNCYGQVIGINTLKIDDSSESVEGIGLAIPSSTVKQVVDQLIAQGYVSGRPDWAMEGDAVSELEQRWYRLPAGILVTALRVGGCAENAGLNLGDVILSIDGTSVTDVDTFNALTYSYRAGDTVVLEVYRSGKQLTISLTLGEAVG